MCGDHLKLKIIFIIKIYIIIHIIIKKKKHVTHAYVLIHLKLNTISIIQI